MSDDKICDNCDTIMYDLVELDYSCLHWCPNCGSYIWTGRHGWTLQTPTLTENWKEKMQINLLDKALEFATKWHEGQKRWNGDKYITHPIRVSDSLNDDIAKIVGLLHDTLEDTECTEQEILDIFGIEVLNQVKYLTRDKNESYTDFIMRMIDAGKNAKIAIQVKIADINDNLRDAKPGSMRDKYELAKILLESRLQSL